MPIKLQLAPLDFQTFLRPWLSIVGHHASRNETGIIILFSMYYYLGLIIHALLIKTKALL